MLGSRWKGHSDAKLDALARLRFVFAGRADHACNGRDPGWVRRYLWQLADTAFVMGRMCCDSGGFSGSCNDSQTFYNMNYLKT